MTTTDTPQPESADATPTRSGSGRAWGVRGLVALASILLVLGTLGIWVQRVVLESQTWTDTSSHVLQDRQVQEALSTYLVQQLYDNVDVAGELRDALPPRAKPLAGPVAAGLQNVLAQSAQRALASSQAQTVWRRANSTASSQLIRLLDKRDGALTTTNGAVVLDLHPLVARIAGQNAISRRFGALPPGAGRIVLLRSNQLETAQTAAKILKAIALILLPIIFLIFALAVWIAPDRRRAIKTCAIGVILAGLVLVFLRRVLGDALIDRLVVNESMRPAAHDVWWIVSEQLGLAITSILFVGIVGLLGAWIAGPGRRATTLRGALAPALRDNRCWLALAVVVLVLIAWAPTPGARNWITVVILTLLAVVGLEALRRQTEREFPAGTAEPVTLPNIWSRREPVAAPTPAPDDQRLERLRRLGQLRADGVLSDEEFSQEKARVLAGTPS